MDYQIRALCANEVEMLRPFLEGLAKHHNSLGGLFAGTYPTMPIDLHLHHMADHIRNDSARILGLFLGDDCLIGFGMASWEEKFGEIDYLFIDESHRDAGMGGALVDRLLAYLREKDVAIIDVKVVAGNPARRFYERHGFSLRSEVLSLTPR